MDTFISNYLGTGIVAGLVGAVAMVVVMTLITKSGWAHGNMVIALGSLLTRSRNHAALVGSIAHVVIGAAFGVFYTFIILKLGFTTVGSAFATGLCIGIVHGLIVSLTLVWVVAEEHPLEEFSSAGFEVGLTHLAGHLVYGAAVGLAVALALKGG